MPLFNLPDGRILDIPENPSEELKSDLRAKLAEDFPEEYGENFSADGDNRTILGSIGETVKSVPRGFLQGLGMTVEGLLSLGGMDDDNPVLDAVQDWTQSWNTEGPWAVGEGYEDSFMVKFGTGVGNVGSFFAPALLSGGTSLAASALGTAGRTGKALDLTSKALAAKKFGMPVSTVPLAVGMGASEQLDYRELAREKGLDISGSEQFLSKIAGGAIGLTELAPLWRIFRKIPKSAEGKALVNDALSQLLRKESRAYLAGSAGGQALGEGIQEAGAGLLQRAVAKGLYDPSLDVGESIFDEFTVGASVGAFVDLMSEVALPRSRYRTGFDKSGKAIEVSYNESESTEEQIILADEQENAGKKQQKKQHKIHREDILNLSPVVEQGRNGWNIVDKKTNRIIEVVNQEATAINQVNRLNREIKDAKRMAQVSKDANELGVVGNSTDQSILIQTSAPEYSSISRTELAQNLDENPKGNNGKQIRDDLSQKLRKRASKLKDSNKKSLLTKEYVSFEDAVKYKLLPNKKSVDLFFGRRAESADKRQGKRALKQARNKNGNITVESINKILKAKNLTSTTNSPEFKEYSKKIVGTKDFAKMTRGQKELLAVRLQDIPRRLNPAPMLDVTNVLTGQNRIDKEPLKRLLADVATHRTPKEYTRKEIKDISQTSGAETTQLINRLLQSKRLTKTKNNKYVFFDGSLKLKNGNPVEGEAFFQKYMYENGSSFMESPRDYASRLAKLTFPNTNSPMFTDLNEMNSMVESEFKRRRVNQLSLDEMQSNDLRERLVAANIAGEAPQAIERTPEEVITRERQAQVIRKKLEPKLKKLTSNNKELAIAISPILRSENNFKKFGELDKNTEGVYLSRLNTIFLNIEAIDPDLNKHIDDIEAALSSVLDHEIVHALIDLKLFKNKELINLKKYATNTLVPESYDLDSAKRKETFVQRAARINPNLRMDIEAIEEEAIAEMYRAWSKDNKLVTGQPRSLLQRILDFFTSIFSGLKGSGFNSSETYDAIALSITEGEIGKREAQSDIVEVVTAGIEDAKDEVDDDEEDRRIDSKAETLFTKRETPELLPSDEISYSISPVKNPGPNSETYQYLNQTSVGYPVVSSDPVTKRLVEVYEAMRRNGIEGQFGQQQIEAIFQDMGVELPDGINIPNIETLRNRIVKSYNEGNDSHWYKRFGKTIQSIVGPANMVEFSVVLAITSGQNAVNSNLMQTLDTMMEIRKIKQELGKLPSEAELTKRLKQNAIYNGQQAKSVAKMYKEGNWNTSDIGYAKTPTFARSMFAGTQGDFFPFGTMDIHMMRAYGFEPVYPQVIKSGKNKGKPHKQAGELRDIPTANEQSVMQFLNTVLSTQAYETKDGSSSFAPDEIQALGWFEQRRRTTDEKQFGDATIDGLFKDQYVARSVRDFEEMKKSEDFDVSSSLDEGLSSINDILYKGRANFLGWNGNLDPLYYLHQAVAPTIVISPNPGVDTLNMSEALSLNQMEDLSDRLFNAMTNEYSGRPQIEFVKDMGIPHEIRKTYGGWNGKAEPSYIITFPTLRYDTDEITSIAQILGSALRQDATVISQPNYGGDYRGIIIRKENGEPISREDVVALAEGADGKGLYFEGNNLGFTLEMIPEDNSVFFMDVGSFGLKNKAEMEERASQFAAFLKENISNILGTPIELNSFNTEGDLLEREEGHYRGGKDKDGNIRPTPFEGIRRYASVSGSSNLQTAAFNTLFEPIEREIRNFFELEKLPIPPEGISALNDPLSALEQGQDADNFEVERAKKELEEVNLSINTGGIPPYNLRYASATAIETANRMLNSDNDSSFIYDNQIDEDYKASKKAEKADFDNYGTPFKSITYKEDQEIHWARKMLNTLNVPFLSMMGKGTFSENRKDTLFDTDIFKKIRRGGIDKYDQVRKEEDKIAQWLKEAGKDEEAEKLIRADSSAQAAITFSERARAFLGESIKNGGIFQFVDGKGRVTNDWKNGTTAVVPVELEIDDQGRTVNASFLNMLGKLHQEVIDEDGSKKTISLEQDFANYMIWRRVTSLRDNDLLDESELKKQLEDNNMLKNFLENDFYFEKLIENKPQIKEAADIYDALNDKVIDYAITTNLLDQEQGDLFKQLASFYPFYREYESSDNPGYGIFNIDETNGFKDVFDTAVSPTKLTGEFQNPVEAIMKNWLSIVSAGQKNVARLRTIEMLKLGQQVAPKDEANIENMVIPLGLRKGLRKEMEKGINVDGVFVPMDKTKVMAAKVNGEETFYYVDDPGIAYAFENLGEPALNGFLKFVGAPASVLREMVTRDPAFIVVNMMRDTLSAYATSGADITPFLSTIRGFGSDISNLEKYGVVGGYDLAGDPKDFMKFMNKQLRNMGRDKNGGLDPENAFIKLWDKMGNLTTRSDAATRQAVFQDVYKKTGSAIEASFQALEIINFNRRGGNPLFRVVTTAIPFLNARIQGLDVLYRAGSGSYSSQYLDRLDDKTKTLLQRTNARRFFTRMVTLMGITALYWLMVSDSEEYEELNAKKEIRDDNWIIPMGDRYSFKLPIPFEVGVITKVLPERFLNLTLGDDNFKEFRDALTRQMETTFKVIPWNWQIIAPLREAFNNKSDYTGREIVPYWMLSSRIPEERYNENTSLWARSVGAALNISPLKIDHVARGYLGTIGTYGLLATDIVSRSAVGEPVIPMNINNTPLVKRFAMDSVHGGGLVQDFYQMRGELDRLIGTMNKLRKEGRLEEVEALMQSYGDLYKNKGRLRWIERYLSKWRTKRNIIMRDKSIDYSTRKSLIEQMNLERDRVLLEVPKIKKMVGSPFGEL